MHPGGEAPALPRRVVSWPRHGSADSPGLEATRLSIHGTGRWLRVYLHWAVFAAREGSRA